MKVALIEVHNALNSLEAFPENTWGVIRKWGTSSEYVGTIVRRKGLVLYSLESILGDGSRSWNNWTRLSQLGQTDYQIEILPPGSKIEITL